MRWSRSPRNANTARSWTRPSPPRRSSRPPLTSNERKGAGKVVLTLLTTSHISKEAQKVLGWFGGYGFGGRMGVFTQ